MKNKTIIIIAIAIAAYFIFFRKRNKTEKKVTDTNGKCPVCGGTVQTIRHSNAMNTCFTHECKNCGESLQYVDGHYEVISQ